MLCTAQFMQRIVQEVQAAHNETASQKTAFEQFAMRLPQQQMLIMCVQSQSACNTCAMCLRTSVLAPTSDMAGCAPLPSPYSPTWTHQAKPGSEINILQRI